MEYDSSLHLFVDKPNIVGTKALQPIRGTLQIEGWALAREGVAAIDVSINGQHTGTAKYGLRREDVGANWPDWENSRLSGYALPIPARALATGVNLVRVALRARTGRMKVVEFSIETEQPPKENTPWALRRKMARSEIDVTEGILSGLDWHPLLGIVLGVDDSDDDATVIAALQSLREQVYGRWHAIVACKGGDVRERLVPLLGREFADLVERVRIAAESEVGSFADAIARGNGVRRPDLIGILSAGDVLACDALLQMAVSSGLERDGEFFYSDERRTSPISGSVESFLSRDGLLICCWRRITSGGSGAPARPFSSELVLGSDVGIVSANTIWCSVVRRRRGASGTFRGCFANGAGRRSMIQRVNANR